MDPGTVWSGCYNVARSILVAPLRICWWIAFLWYNTFNCTHVLGKFI